jgi:hypothetical protein
MAGMADWDLAVGDTLSREARSQRYGGATYGGIQPSATTPNVFVYSDPSRGRAYGYNFDGWNQDHTSFLYTGEGRVGDQQLTHGNRAILDHKQDGRALRVFVADGLQQGTAAKIQRYLGQFEVDGGAPYTRTDAPDVNSECRSVIVFRLRPVGHVLHRDQDRSATDDITPTTTADLVDLEAHDTAAYETSGSPPTTADRRESELVQRYKQHLEASGHTVRRWRLRPAGEVRPLLTDLYDVTNDELYEAKGVATRDAIRRAIGQLLDYRRHTPRRPVRLTVLLPSCPSKDLLALLTEVGMACVFEEARGTFRRHSSP